jgi:hypothetical protein
MSGLFILVFSTPTETGGGIGLKSAISEVDEEAEAGEEEEEEEAWMAVNTEFTLDASYSSCLLWVRLFTGFLFDATEYVLVVSSDSVLNGAA